MTRHRTLAWILATGACACGGSGGGGGGTPVNLMNFQAAGDIIGQGAANGGSANNGGGATPNQVGFSPPTGHQGNGSLYVVDFGNNRILGFADVPTGFGQSADFVVGQGAFNTMAPGTTETTLSGPRSCWVASGALFVADGGNGRVLIFNTLPTATGAAAAVALGQPNLMTSGFGAGPDKFQFPGDVCVAANRIVVADVDNDRVMIWNGIPANSGAPAQLVVGQIDFNGTTPGLSATRMEGPEGVWTDGTRLVVADTAGNRVLIWTTFPTFNGQAADIVVGQPDFDTGSPGTGPQKMNIPGSVCSDGSKLFVADRQNHRVLIFDPFPTSSNPVASGVLGQSNFTNVAANDDDQNGVSDAQPSARTMSFPSGVTTIGNKLFVTDSGNNRVLIFTGS